MHTIPNKKPFTLQGRRRYRARNLARLMGSAMKVSARRLVHGPILPGWKWAAEVGADFLREQFFYAFTLDNPAEGREYLDALLFHAPMLEQVQVDFVDGAITGAWFTPPEPVDEQPLLFFPGGGYVFNPLSTATLHAHICLAANRRLFAVTYPLAPEHPFPAQLEEAKRAYLWMVEEQGIEPGSLIVGGASAGGNLCLALLLALREQDRPRPALAFLLSPWVDIGNSGNSMTENEPHDWISMETSAIAAGYFCGRERIEQPLISPLYADLHDLAPLYIQAGGSEIFIDMIRAFSARAVAQGALIQLEVWEKMIHCFQAFGDDVPESIESLDRLGEVIGGGGLSN